MLQTLGRVHIYIVTLNLINHLYKHKAILPYAFFSIQKCMCKNSLLLYV